MYVTLQDGTKAATPLLLTLAVIELSDVVFAVDSIPAGVDASEEDGVGTLPMSIHKEKGLEGVPNHVIGWVCSGAHPLPFPSPYPIISTWHHLRSL